MVEREEKQESERCRGREEKETERVREGDRWKSSACYNLTILSLGRGHTHYITEWSHIIHPVNGLYLNTTHLQ